MKENIYSYMTEKQLKLVSFALNFLKSNLDHDVIEALVDINEGYDEDVLGMEEAIEDVKGCFEVMVEIESKKEEKLFKIAFCKADGSWDIYEKIYVSSKSEANKYAEDHYGSHPDRDLRDWYILDENNKNING